MGGFPKNETEIEVVDKRIVKRVTISNFFSNVLEAFNISRGGIYTAKRLLINPGQLAKDFIGVERHRITPPINVLIISTAVVLILANSIDAISLLVGDSLKVSGPIQEDIKSQIQEDIKSQIIQVFSSYFNLLLWIYIPITAMFSYLLNRKRGLNYAENLVFQTYNLSLTNFIFIILFPLTYYSANVFYMIYFVLAPIYMIYAYKVFYRKKWMRSILETLGIYFIGSLFWLIIMTIVLVFISQSVAQLYVIDAF